MANKFTSTIAGSAEGIKLARATAVANSAEIAQKALINNLYAKKNRLEVEQGQLTDLAPESGDSLRPAPNFNATQWAAGVQSVKLQLNDVDREIAAAESTYAEWFGTPASA
jgi:hypothetical protein